MLKVLVIVGPTAVGKSSLAIACAQKYHGEIISGDAIQVYKGLDIGSAKVSKAEQKMVKHHLIDIIDPKMRYSVKDFQTYARKLINEIHERHHLPIIVGGTGLYIKATIYDYQFNEESAEDDDFAALTNAEIYERIKEVDPEILEKIHINNRKRLVRALNIINKQKMPMSHILQAQEHKPLYDAYIMGLTMPREILYERIDKRVDKMMEEGLLAEVEALLKAGLSFDDQAMQAIGYKEFRPYFEKGADLESCIAMIKRNSRHFAKRQYTWFRHQTPIVWYDVNQKGKAFEDIEKWMKT